ncbi:MAG: hypothetical protein HFI93_08495 [Lachnospiraceae bacterium]|nr:hypothetical protein [Lachnospiraceae bacterium]
MSANKELLNDIYQNAEMGILTIPQLLEIAKDEDFRRVLNSQLKEYREISGEALRLMGKRQIEPEDLGTFTKIRTDLMTQFQTLTDSSVSHLAEMMVQGNTMGSTAIVRRIHEHPQADEEVLKLAKRLQKTTEDNTEQIRKFL